MDRREALKKLAVGGATLVGASALVTQPAFADSGSVRCRNAYTSPAVLSGTVVRSIFGAGPNANFALAVSVPGPPSCPCGGTPTVTYAFWATATANTTASSTPMVWGASNTFTASLNIGYAGFLDLDFSYTIRVGVQVQCRGRVTPFAYVCRFMTSTGSGAGGYTITGVAVTSPTGLANLPTCS